jgi:hypothetical protein
MFQYEGGNNMPVTKAIRLKVPAWLDIEQGGQEILKPLAAEARLKVEYYRSQMKYFEQKYNISFAAFRRKVNSDPEENTAQWDDFIEWEVVAKAFNEWKKKYRDLAECLKLSNN